MKFIKVESSVINGVQYDDRSIYVRFNSGVIYRYLNVNHRVFNDFLEADSIGKFFNQKIRNCYLWKEVQEKDLIGFNSIIERIF